MVAGLDVIHGKPVPNQVFGDAYVLGFVQQLVMFAATAAHGGKPPKTEVMSNIMTSAIDQLVPGFGSQLVSSLLVLNNPTHPLNPNYQVGRREGTEYIVALTEGNEEKQVELIKGFQNFVARNYLGFES